MYTNAVVVVVVIIVSCLLVVYKRRAVGCQHRITDRVIIIHCDYCFVVVLPLICPIVFIIIEV